MPVATHGRGNPRGHDQALDNALKAVLSVLMLCSPPPWPCQLTISIIRSSRLPIQVSPIVRLNHLLDTRLLRAHASDSFGPVG